MTSRVKRLCPASFSKVSSKPIIYWITEAPSEELFAKVDQLVYDIGDRVRSGYNVAATVALEIWPKVRQRRRPLFALGVLLTMLAVHKGFYEEMRVAEGQDMAEFDSFVEFLHARLYSLMSAREPFLPLIYSLLFFVDQRCDPLGHSQRKLYRLPPLRKVPES